MKERRLFWNIVDKIEKDIDAGLHPVGSRLPPERELAEQFNVSRPTIREAMIALEVRERIEVKIGSGVYIIESKSRSRRNSEAIGPFELTQARALIEGEAAALAAASISNDELEALEVALNNMDDPELGEEADKEFHLVISRATHNNAILSVVQQFWDVRESSAEIKEAYSAVCRQSNEKRYDEHREIYEALKNHDVSGSRAAMHHHFNRLINALFDVKEAEALEEIKRRNSQTRGQFSLNHLVES